MLRALVQDRIWALWLTKWRRRSKAPCPDTNSIDVPVKQIPSAKGWAGGTLSSTTSMVACHFWQEVEGADLYQVVPPSNLDWGILVTKVAFDGIVLCNPITEFHESFAR